MVMMNIRTWGKPPAVYIYPRRKMQGSRISQYIVDILDISNDFTNWWNTEWRTPARLCRPEHRQFFFYWWIMDLIWILWRTGFLANAKNSSLWNYFQTFDGFSEGIEAGNYFWISCMNGHLGHEFCPFFLPCKS